MTDLEVQVSEPPPAFLLPSPLCGLDLLLGFHCESLEVSEHMCPGVLGTRSPKTTQRRALW